MRLRRVRAAAAPTIVSTLTMKSGRVTSPGTVGLIVLSLHYLALYSSLDSRPVGKSISLTSKKRSQKSYEFRRRIDRLAFPTSSTALIHGRAGCRERQPER